MQTHPLWGGGSLQVEFFRVVIWCHCTGFSVPSLLNLIPQVKILKCNTVAINVREPVFGFSEEVCWRCRVGCHRHCSGNYLQMILRREREYIIKKVPQTEPWGTPVVMKTNEI